MPEGLLDGPCVFCSYNGVGYWQGETHAQFCPWHHIGGAIERAKLLRDVVHHLYLAAGPLAAQVAEVVMSENGEPLSVPPPLSVSPAGLAVWLEASADDDE